MAGRVVRTPGERPAASADGNLLFGVLALQLDFITRDALIEALQVWLLEKSMPLGEILVARAHLTPARRNLIGALAEEHLAAHAQDPGQSLAALSIARADLQALTSRVADAGMQASLAGLPISDGADPEATIATGPGAAGSMRYRILRPHARGGLGEVFVARDEEMRREVALKAIHQERAHDPASRSRFLLEAEITGGLEHPGIVPVYGMGQYDDGRPYYAMRFIRGENLKEAIERFQRGDAGSPDGGKRNLALRELLGRFVDVCQAVAYAHSRGVLHRDLKPANVMLGRYGETLVVDWGLAKSGMKGQEVEAREVSVEPVLQPASGSGSTPTQAGTALGTLGFMSPEQAAGRIDLLSPVSDVYSLGATLYTLLIGAPPFGGTDQGEVLQRVCSGDFLPPCQVNKAVPAPLGAICCKAMALRPRDRYASALDLAADVENWLADEAVTAYRERLLPRLARWARRHRPLVAGAAALLVTAVVALSAGIVLVDRERQHTLLEQEKTKEALEAESIARQRAREALDQMSSQVIEDWLARRKELEPAQKVFLEKALAYYEAFAAETGDREDLRSSVANAYLRIGKIHIQLGQHDAAERAFHRALALYEPLASAFSTVPDHAQSMANGHLGLGSLLRDTGRLKEAEEQFRDALAILKQLAVDFPTVPGYRQGLARVQVSLATLLREESRPNEAKDACGDALAIQNRLVLDFPGEPAYRVDLAHAHASLGALRAVAGRPNEALDSFHESLAILKTLITEFPGVPAYREELASCHYGLGIVLSGTSAKREAEQAYQDALAIQKQLAAEFPSVPTYRQDLARTHQNLANLFERGGRSKEALATSREALAIKKQLAADFPLVLSYRTDLGRSYLNLGINLMDAGQANEAEAAMNEALAIHRGLAKQYPETPAHRQAVLQSQGFLALLWAGNGEHARAIAEVAELEKMPQLSAGRLYDLACACSRSSAAAKKDAKLSSPLRIELSEQYAVRAVSLLSRALANGYSDVANLRKDTDLAPLRGRADFKKLLQQIEKPPQTEGR